EQGVRMLVTPVPVRLLIALVGFGKIAILAMVLFHVNAIRPIFMTIPFMIVIVVLVVVGASVLLIGLLLVGSQGRWRYCDWGYKGGAQQGRVPEAGHSYLLPVDGAIVAPNTCRASGERNEQNTRRLMLLSGARRATAGVQELHMEVWKCGTCQRRAPRRCE